MNTLHINSIDNRGGAAKLANRLVSELNKLGHSSKIMVAHKTEANDEVIEFAKSVKRESLNQKYRLSGLIYKTYEQIAFHPFFANANIVHLHNIHLMPHGFFNIRDLVKLGRAKPTVWTLHDSWPVYEFGATPEYDVYFRKESKLFLSQKHRAIKKANVHLVVPSRWLEKLMRKFYPNKPVTRIPHGVDTDIFFPRDKAKMRSKLGLPKRGKLVLFIANGGEDSAPKGGEYLQKVREALSDKDVSFISLGSTREGTYIKDETEIAQYYSAADAFISPSLAESFSLVALEAMACGTPVVAFEVGGVPDVVSHNQDGYLARYKDTDDLIHGLEFILWDNKAKLFGQKAAGKVARTLSLDIMVKAYIKLYEEIAK